MTAYLTAQLTIHDRTRYQQYEAGFLEIFSKYQGTLLSVDENPTPLEGEWPHTRTVLISFPDQPAALAWFNSPEYQALAEHRRAASVGQIVMLNGLDAAAVG